MSFEGSFKTLNRLNSSDRIRKGIPQFETFNREGIKVKGVDRAVE